MGPYSKASDVPFHKSTLRLVTSFTCDLSLLDGEWDDQVEWSQPRHIQTVHSHWSVCCLGDRGQGSDMVTVGLQWQHTSWGTQ